MKDWTYTVTCRLCGKPVAVDSRTFELGEPTCDLCRRAALNYGARAMRRVSRATGANSGAAAYSLSCGINEASAALAPPLV